MDPPIGVKMQPYAYNWHTMDQWISQAALKWSMHIRSKPSRIHKRTCGLVQKTAFLNKRSQGFSLNLPETWRHHTTFRRKYIFISRRALKMILSSKLKFRYCKKERQWSPLTYQRFSFFKGPQGNIGQGSLSQSHNKVQALYNTIQAYVYMDRD